MGKYLISLLGREFSYTNTSCQTILAATLFRERGHDFIVYNIILFTNILRILEERGLTKSELAESADMSISFLSDLTNGKANPSLKILEQIAQALDTPLPMLLESSDLDQEAMDAIAGGKMPQSLPKGYVRISAVLPEAQAFVVRKWDAAAKKKLMTLRDT